MVDMNAIQGLVEAIKEPSEDTNKTYSAVVSRIDNNGVAWVYLAGSEKETPTASTSSEISRGDIVNVEWRNNKLYIAGNSTNPSAGVIRVEAVEQATQVANEAAANAVQSANEAHAAAEDAKATADSVHDIAVQASEDAEDAKESATTANTAANGALSSLSTVQDVIGVLDWASKNAEYTLTSDTAITPGKIYWTRSGAGTEADPYVYTPVVNPVVADIGTYYEISGVDEAMANYVNSHMALTDEGLYIMADGSAWKVLVADDGVYIIDPSGNKVAKYKADTTLGIDDGSQSFLKLDYHSMQLIDKEGDVYFYVSDLRNEQGYYEVTQNYTGNGSQTIFMTKYPIQHGTNPAVTGVSIPFSWTDQSSWRSSVQFSTAPSDGTDFTISYRTVDPFAKAFTFGSRGTTDMGGRSVAFGYNVEASGTLSFAEGYVTKATDMATHAEGYGSQATRQAAHAEGDNSQASGKNSHAEGDHSQASGTASHAEGFHGVASGNYSHAENGTASGSYSHAEGENTSASGSGSHAQNGYTKASSDYQTALGKYNIEDNANTYAVIVGNGRSNSRSNAATLDWLGNTYQQGRNTTADMTTQEISDFVNTVPTGFDNLTNLSVTNHITAGGDITDGSGNVLSSIAAHAVISTGSTGGWTYKKYADGTFEATRFSNSGATGTMTQLGSSGIYYSSAAEITFPSIGITSIRSCLASVMPSSNYLMSYYMSRLTTAHVYFSYIRYGSGAAVTDISYEIAITGTYS